jgi:hypothetical protein
LERIGPSLRHYDQVILRGPAGSHPHGRRRTGRVAEVPKVRFGDVSPQLHILPDRRRGHGELIETSLASVDPRPLHQPGGGEVPGTDRAAQGADDDLHWLCHPDALRPLEKFALGMGRGSLTIRGRIAA